MLCILQKDKAKAQLHCFDFFGSLSCMVKKNCYQAHTNWKRSVQKRPCFYSRIWEQIINKSVDNLKKTEFQLLIEEQKAQKERLANIESALKAIEANLIGKTDKK